MKIAMRALCSISTSGHENDILAPVLNWWIFYRIWRAREKKSRSDTILSRKWLMTTSFISADCLQQTIQRRSELLGFCLDAMALVFWSLCKAIGLCYRVRNQGEQTSDMCWTRTCTQHTVSSAISTFYNADRFNVALQKMINCGNMSSWLLCVGQCLSNATRCRISAPLVLLPVTGIRFVKSITPEWWYDFSFSFWTSTLNKLCSPRGPWQSLPCKIRHQGWIFETLNSPKSWNLLLSWTTSGILATFMSTLSKPNRPGEYFWRRHCAEFCLQARSRPLFPLVGWCWSQMLNLHLDLKSWMNGWPHQALEPDLEPQFCCKGHTLPSRIATLRSPINISRFCIQTNTWLSSLPFSNKNDKSTVTLGLTDVNCLCYFCK